MFNILLKALRIWSYYCGVLLDGLTATYLLSKLCMVLVNIPEIIGNDERRSKIYKGILELPKMRMSCLMQHSQYMCFTVELNLIT
jgi:hypothetical protein